MMDNDFRIKFFYSAFIVLCLFDKLHPAVIFPDRLESIGTVTNTPNGKTNRNSNIAIEKCREYSKLQFVKEDVSTVASQEPRATPQEFPHTVLLGYGNTTENRNDFKCGGSLISERWILTTAGCHQVQKGRTTPMWARLGDFDIDSTSDLAQHQDYKIVQHVIHPDYKKRTFYDDIALFRLEKDVTFSAFVRPICLNTNPTPTPDEFTVSGWGVTKNGGSTDGIMSKVFMENFPVNQCNATYNTLWALGVLSDSMICAGPKYDDIDTCWGFSGSPLQTVNGESNTDTYTQFGLASFGSKCGDKNIPGVYTRVSKYVEWIEKIVWPQNQ